MRVTIESSLWHKPSETAKIHMEPQAHVKVVSCLVCRCLVAITIVCTTIKADGTCMGMH